MNCKYKSCKEIQKTKRVPFTPLERILIHNFECSTEFGTVINNKDINRHGQVLHMGVEHEQGAE